MVQLPIRKNARAGIFGSTIFLAALLAAPTIAVADEDGVSFWIPGLFGSLAAAPQQPGWQLANIYYHTSVSASGDAALAREFTINAFTRTLNAEPQP